MEKREEQNRRKKIHTLRKKRHSKAHTNENAINRMKRSKREITHLKNTKNMNEKK